MTIENLPIPQNEFLTELGVVLPPPSIVQADADLDETRKADIQLFNTALRIHYAMWGEVKTFNAVMSMMDKTFALIEKRRAILGHPYGSPQNKTSQGDVYDPLP